MTTLNVSRKWSRMAQLYRRFAGESQDADFSDAALLSMYAHESQGTPLLDALTNGYTHGKKWMDVTVAMWKEDIRQGTLRVVELQTDGYPDWFLVKVGVLPLTRGGHNV